MAWNVYAAEFACRASLCLPAQEEFTTPAEEKQINSLYTVAWQITDLAFVILRGPEPVTLSVFQAPVPSVLEGIVST